MKDFFYSLIILGFCASCISPANIDPTDPDFILVVDGFITDQPGPHAIRITRVARFAGVRQGGEITLEDVDVRIIDDQGNVTVLAQQRFQAKSLFDENPPFCAWGIAFSERVTDYLTPSTFQGVVGRSYTLEITTEAGQVYRSNPQEILPTPPIESLQLQFVEIPNLSDFPGSGVDVLATWQDAPGPDFYFWQINGIYRISTPDTGPPACCVYDPRDGLADDCWIVERNIPGNTEALSDARFNGQLQTEKVGFIEDDGLRFASINVSTARQYHVEVEQYRISEEAYFFYERTNTLADIDGEIFDPPPLSIRGNIFNVENEEELVIGFFGAFSVETAEVFVNRDMLPFVQRFTEPCGDCRIRAGAQTEIPEPYRF